MIYPLPNSHKPDPEFDKVIALFQKAINDNLHIPDDLIVDFIEFINLYDYCFTFKG